MKKIIFILIVLLFNLNLIVIADTCLSPNTIYCGDSVTGTLADGDDELTGDTCAGYPDYAFEDKYAIYIEDVPATLYVQITNNTQGYQDVSITSACNYDSCLAGDYVDPGYTWDISASIENEGLYYILITAEDEQASGPYTLSVSCDLQPSPLNCNNEEVGPIFIACGETVNGDTSTNRVYNVSEYNCCTNCYNYGPELVYIFDLASVGPAYITALLYIDGDPAPDLDLFLLSACSENTCIALSKTSSNPEILESPLLRPTTYYLVVDGYGWAAGSFSLTLLCYPQNVTPTPSPSPTVSPTPTTTPTPPPLPTLSNSAIILLIILFSLLFGLKKIIVKS